MQRVMQCRVLPSHGEKALSSTIMPVQCSHSIDFQLKSTVFLHLFYRRLPFLLIWSLNSPSLVSSHMHTPPLTHTSTQSHSENLCHPLSTRSSDSLNACSLAPLACKMAGEKSRRAEGREALNCGENGGGGLRERELWGVGGRGMKKDVGKCWWDRHGEG